ncbi:YitT family protein [Clostridium sp. MSJ-11]|uniref:YitT family protein n=1 Tax=Clostridium mobile TaxID=2841512 RepID=A0ABS6EKF7_9CLOT|nr:YitT family protein [Clostridium mobile]MBU5485156.1 YitT family protein [Clostridium mobile]
MKKFKEYFFITLGVFMVALSTNLLLAPNKIAAGGVIGIAIIVNNIVPFLSIGLITLIMNVILFIIAFIFIGSKFGGKTIYASLSLSGFIWLLEDVFKITEPLTNNLFLAFAFGTIIAGIGMGITFNQNASTGGTDIIAKIASKFFNIPIGKSLLAIDFIITIFSAISFGIEIGMYSLLSVLFNGFVIDFMIEGLNICKQVMVVSDKCEEISKFIIDELERGCTFINGIGAYTRKETYILYTVLSRREFIRLKEYIKEIDKKAFITVGDVHEVLGEGFKDIAGEE